MSALDDGQPQYLGRGVTYVVAAPPTLGQRMSGRR